MKFTIRFQKNRWRICLPFWLYLLTIFGNSGIAQQTPAIPNTRQALEALQTGKYLQALSQLEQLDSSHEMVKQELATVRSFVGDYLVAVESWQDTEATDIEKINRQIEAYESATALPALDAIVEAAKKKQIVILNEAHHVPRHRAFALQLAIRLRELGFEYFAAENFSPMTEALQQRGYPDLLTGFYSIEPVFGDLIRQALHLEYLPIAYETTSMPPSHADATDRINHREKEQCQNLINRVFAHKPEARIFIFVGYSHVTEEPTILSDGRVLAWMAARLKKETGIDPLTIDQTTNTENGSVEQVENPWHDLLDKCGASGPLVFEHSDAQFLVQGIYSGKVDMQVIHPPTRLVQGRPDWLFTLAGRHAVEIPADIPKSDQRVLVQAFVSSESETAVPADQVLILPEQKPPVLALREGKYRIAVQSEDGKSIQHSELIVE